MITLSTERVSVPGSGTRTVTLKRFDRPIHGLHIMVMSEGATITNMSAQVKIAGINVGSPSVFTTELMHENVYAAAYGTILPASTPPLAVGSNIHVYWPYNITVVFTNSHTSAESVRVVATAHLPELHLQCAQTSSLQ